MSRRHLWIAAGALAAVLVLLLLLRTCGGDRERRQEGPQATVPGSAGGLDGDELPLPVDLYFPDTRGWLRAEPQELAVSGDPAIQIRAVVESLLAGPPKGSGLVRLLPEGVGVAGIYLSSEGVAFLDLATAEPQEPPAMGSRQEMQIVYSLVNSVALNISEVRRVVLLWNGRQRATFAGHLDISRPLAPNTDLVAR